MQFQFLVVVAVMLLARAAFCGMLLRGWRQQLWWLVDRVVILVVIV